MRVRLQWVTLPNEQRTLQRGHKGVAPARKPWLQCDVIYATKTRLPHIWWEVEASLGRKNSVLSRPGRALYSQKHTGFGDPHLHPSTGNLHRCSLETPVLAAILVQYAVTCQLFSLTLSSPVLVPKMHILLTINVLVNMWSWVSAWFHSSSENLRPLQNLLSWWENNLPNQILGSSRSTSSS